MIPGVIETTLRARRDAGHKLLVPYVTAGLGPDWVDVLCAIASAGADAIEVGIPFSDPLMDGPVIQRATHLALEQGATPIGVIGMLSEVDAGVPLAAMTSYNIAFRAGHERFARSLVASGVRGAILPDLPVDELGDWAGVAADAGIETILLAAPTTPDDRLALICARSRGWVYGVGVLGVTGERDTLASSAAVIAKRLKAQTDLPVLVGVGVSTAEQAVEACTIADGVIVGSALVRRLLEGAGPEGAAAFVAELRTALDAARDVRA
jgi:tryptophan synthase alpha chain